MVSRKWTNREINEALQRLGTCYELPPERSAALEARVRREVIALYGRFDISLMAHGWKTDGARITDVHTREPVGRGILVLLPALRSFVSGVGRPAFALAGVAAVAVGAVIAFQRSGLGPFRTQEIRQPVVAPQAEMVAVAAPIVPGSGVAVSVFGLAPASSLQPPAVSSHPSVPRRVRRAGKPINPASGVFDQWGESVFTDEEYLRSERWGKNVFNS